MWFPVDWLFPANINIQSVKDSRARARTFHVQLSRSSRWGPLGISVIPHNSNAQRARPFGEPLTINQMFPQWNEKLTQARGIFAFHIKEQDSRSALCSMAICFRILNFLFICFIIYWSFWSLELLLSLHPPEIYRGFFLSPVHLLS